MKKLENEETILREIQNGINVSQNFNKIIEQHSGIFVKMCNRYNFSSQPFKKQDVMSDKNLFIYKCIMDYNFDKNTKFSTYLGFRVKWFCLNYYNKYKKEWQNTTNLDFEDLDNYKCEENLNEEIDSRDLIKKILKKMKNDPDKRIYKIFQMRYFQGKENKLMPWSQISQNKDIQLSVQGCINIHNKYIQNINKIK